jgi:signal peptidase I
MSLRWFTSRSVRVAGDMSKHVRKILDAQRDILSPPAIIAVQSALIDIKKAIAGADEDVLKKQMENLEKAANKWLKPYPNATIRENVEVLLVALAVAMGIRTFFLQPFKIPTGSMQPTLFGVTPSQPFSKNQPDLIIPNRVVRFFDFWISGYSFFNEVAPEDGVLQAVKPPTKLLLFNLKQEYQFNNQWHTIWFPADELFQRAGYWVDATGDVIRSPQIKAGDPIVRLRVTAGDHLFVDRISYNFRHPARGDIIVFETRGIHYPSYDLETGWPDMPQDLYYIKRLVALGGERVQIDNDRHLVINGKRLDKTTPHFEKIYDFTTNGPLNDGIFPESHYSGHAGIQTGYAPLFAHAPDGTITVRPGYYMVMGDNTMNSADSRYWGDFPRTNVIGKNFFVYWPFSERFGLSVR